MNRALADYLGRVECAENLQWAADLPDACIDLVYIDPPFMTNKVRLQAAGLSYDDRWAGGVESFVEFISERMVAIHRLLRSSGSVYVHLDQRTSHYIKVAVDRVFGAENFLNEIIWSYRTGGTSRRWFARKHDTILVWAKELGKHTFNVQRDGEFRTDGLKYDEKGHPYKVTRKGRLHFNPAGPVLTDVWELPFLSTVSRERVGYPSQKPEALLERIIEASSVPGEVVADLFCGSGTTLVVANRLGRRWLGCDASAEAVKVARGRLGLS